MEKNLVMTFINADGKKVNLKINNVRDSVTEAEVSTVMDTIISKNIFFTSGGDLKSKDSAEIVERNVSDLNVK